jgi:hypothetical protein
MTEPVPFTPFRPQDPDQLHGYSMPPSVPEGLRLELSRAKLVDGKDAEFEEWMTMLNDRYNECVLTLEAEHAVFEATFRHTEADGSVWMYHFSLTGESGGGLDTSNPVDADHEAYARSTKQRGWEELTPKFMLTPSHIRAMMERWGRTGTM